MTIYSLDKTWSTGEGNGKPVFLYCEPHEQYEKAKRYDTEKWTPQVGRCQYATGEEHRNSSRRNKQAEPKQKQHPVVAMSDGESKDQCVKNRILTNKPT